MKKLGMSALSALVLAIFVTGCASTAFGARASSEVDKILNDAWTAYNIGQYKKTISLIKPLADEGYPRAQVMLGRCYDNGLGVAQDPAAAAQWFQLAAEQNDSEAQVLLAYCYETGTGVPKNPAQVMNLMTRAAEAGNPEAQFNLAVNYSQGINGAPKNDQLSYQWASKAAAQGYGQAERFMGACCEYGFGTQANQELAQEWYKKAEAKGYSRQGSIFASGGAIKLPQ